MPTNPNSEMEAMRNAYRVAQELENAEEEEMIRRAIEESERFANMQKSAYDEDEEMMRRVLEMSQNEEDDRQRRLTSIKLQEEQDQANSIRESEE